MKFSNILVIFCSLGVTVLADGETSTCDKAKCRGPLSYYKALNCTGLYRNPEDCCPYKFDCDHLNLMQSDKCYVNDKVYSIGEKLRAEDANACDIGCTCSKVQGVAQFECAAVDCFHGPVKDGCYLKNSPLDCCPGEEICPEKPEDRATCEVDGRVYKDGEYFEIASEPEKSCVCQPGYEGKNVEPFCAAPKHPYCSPEFDNRGYIESKCAPVYYSTQSPQTGCSLFSRCQNQKDELIPRKTKDSPTEDVTCQYGNITMNYGDELNQATGYDSVCVKCICEVGPVPTCQRLPDEECDVTKHPNFD